MSFSIYAANLGKLKVSSSLGEPLKAEIELLSVSAEELPTLAASIASEQAYAAQGITRLNIHNSIKVELAKNPDGSSVLKLRSNQPVSDPYLDVLIQVDWAAGRLQREYTILLDPPGNKPSESAADILVILPSASSSNNNNVASSSNGSANATTADQASGNDTKKAKNQAAQVATPKNEVAASTAEQELTTQAGDTLSAIAKDLQVEGVSLDQMLVGLYENNQEAFSGGNMNRLKVGQIIKVPTKESLISNTPQDASASVRVHASDWNAYRNNLAAEVSTAAAAVDSNQKQSVSGKISTAEDKAAPVNTGSQDVVKLSAADKDANKTLDAKIVALQEEATAREKALKEAEGRTLALEKQIADMRKLLALKNQSMTDLQKNAEAVAKKPELTPEAKVDTPAQEMPKAETATQADKKLTDGAAEAKPEVKAEVKTPDTKLAPPAKAGFFEGLMNSVNLAVLGGVALLGALWMLLANRRKKEPDSFERDIFTSSDVTASDLTESAVLDNATEDVSPSDTLFIADIAESADDSMIGTHDADTIVEADEAAGNDAQLEVSALSDADDTNTLAMQDFDTAENLKQEVAFDSVVGGEPAVEASSDEAADLPINENQKVTEVAVDNSMDFYLGDFPTEASVEVASMNVADELPATGASLAKDNAVQEKTIDLPDMSENPIDQSSDLDMNFDLSGLDVDAALEQKAEIEENAVDDISFDLDFPVDTQNESVNTNDATTVADLSVSDISFDLPRTDGAEISAVESSPQSKELNANTFDLSSISLDLSGTENEFAAISHVAQVVNEPIESDVTDDILSESPDVNIKLDLVAAYIDMDDKEGAQELLEEIIKEGGPLQKLRAQQLIDSLA